jgi:predicted HicB family RNase H-like nuclease
MTPVTSRRRGRPRGIETAAFGVRIPAELYSQLYLAARAHRASISGFVRMLIQAQLGQFPNTNIPSQK